MTTAAWLIERDDVPLCYSDGTRHRWVSFTDAHAWRFNWREDAEFVIRTHGLTGVTAREHSWT